MQSPQAMHSPQALVILDCDGVLVDTEPLAVAVRERVLAEAGWPLTPDEIVERFLGRSHAYVVAEVATRVGERAARQAEDSFRRGCQEAFRESLTPVPGIVEALDALDVMDGVQTCVASSGGHDKMRFTLGLTGMWPRFEGRIFSAEEVSEGKPAPDLFLHAAGSMGFAPDRCVVVEDSPAGVEAAIAAGMPAIGYVGGVVPSHLASRPGVHLIDDMRTLPAAVDVVLRRSMQAPRDRVPE